MEFLNNPNPNRRDDGERLQRSSAPRSGRFTVPMDLSDGMVKTLTGLASINIDSAKGWREAAEHIKEPALQQTFERIAGTRDAFAGELSRLLTESGRTADAHSTVAGTVHRWWLNVRSSVMANNLYVVLAEAERGEDAIKREYETALGTHMTTELASLLTSQYRHVKRIHDEVHDLRDMYKPA